ncbi:MAG: DUF2173 family protein [Armatimonadetes bacterium]|nr:DUF2173 family protein [Armatimonadota bacterium]
MGTMTVVTASLDELCQIDGVVCAFEFDADGRLVDFKARAGISRDVVELGAEYCATITSVFKTLADSATRLTPMGWTPFHAWCYTGGEYTCVIGGDGYRGVFCETSRCDLNKVHGILSGTR